MVLRIPELESGYCESCRVCEVSPNLAILAAISEAEYRKAREETCYVEFTLDDLKGSDYVPLRNLFMSIVESEIQAVEIRNETSSGLSGEQLFPLLVALGGKLRVLQVVDICLGGDFLRTISGHGLECEVLTMRFSHFRKLNMRGQFRQLRQLNLDFSNSLISFQKDCFSSMPNLRFLSLCETRVSNLWTTVASLSKLPSLTELRFQRLFCKTDGDLTIEPVRNNNVPLKGVQFVESYDLISEPTPDTILETIYSFNNVIDDHGLGETDDDEVEFFIARQEYESVDDIASTISLGNESVPHDEVNLFEANPSQREAFFASSRLGFTTIGSNYIALWSSHICFERHYREFIIASLPNLQVLDEVPIRAIDRERAGTVFSMYFESLPYRTPSRQSLASILRNREINESRTSFRHCKYKKVYPSGGSQYHFSHSLSAAKIGSSAWPSLQPLSFSTNSNSTPGHSSFRPRQFEYHPSDQTLMVFGTLDGEVVVVNYETNNTVCCIPPNTVAASILGLCWLKKFPSLVLAGSDNGTIKLYNIKNVSPSIPSQHFDEFDLLTSVHVNSTDELFLACGYSKNVGLYDIASGKRLQVFVNMHREHINVVKFANHSPFLFASSSFDRDVKLWDLRQNPIHPCYTVSSTKGNVMVCFSPDDRYLLTSAVDNEVKQLLTADGRLHLDFGIRPTRSSQNYTRSYYMNGGDYIISGSCDENVVRVCCTKTGRRLRDVSLEGRTPSSPIFVQSLRSDPHQDFNMSVLVSYLSPNSRSEIVKVNMLSMEEGTPSPNRHVIGPSHGMGG
ncbi:hypothetical protein MLD38_032437 [Melastoma candidum]|uniref:Uncharacterized protein n=1 Tax=Melastoma candidum TaxID=119954 RepID=A0ACB9M484_9MYRT|nr:hypothetical protein MLD38_032437 [Melastoma candidum]